MRLLSSLPADERNAIEGHVRRIPHGWDSGVLPVLRIPTYRPVHPRSVPDDCATPNQIEYMEFEFKRVERGPAVRGTALVANGDVIVQFILDRGARR
jgi:hypothetical protein